MHVPDHIPQYVPNQHSPNRQVICGGQPSSDQLSAFSRARGHTVVNLRTDDEMATLRGWNEGSVVRSLGMRYVRIPIESYDEIDVGTCRILGEAMAQVGGDPIIVHSGSGELVAALMAIKAAWLDRQPLEFAMQIGRDAGLAELEPRVRELIEKGEQNDNAAASRA